MTTLEELTQPLTRGEVEASIYAAIEKRGTDTSSWKPGAVARTIITAVALILSALSYLTAAIAKSGFLELSSGKWLEIVARHVYDVEKIQGTFAEGDVVLDNGGGGVFNVAIGDLVVRHETTGKTYRNTAAFTLAALETGVIVPVQAIELGSGSSAAPDEITEFETPLAGVIVTNPAAVLGFDAESDEQLRVRCRAKLGTLSPNGAKDAYVFAALSAKTDNGASAGATRATTVADGAGGIDVYVASAAGALSGSLGDSSTPLGAVDKAIQDQVVPEGITATVANASELTLDIEYELWVKASIGKTEAELESEIGTELTAFVGQLPIGGSRKVAGPGSVFLTQLAAAVIDVVGDEEDVIDVVFSTPAGNVSVAATEAPVVGSITATINLVSI